MKQNLAFFAQFILLVFGLSLSLNAQKFESASAPNLIIITTDGLRWQEVFNGMDFALANNKKFNHGDSAYLYKKYGAATVTERQSKLLPFITQTMGKKGLLFGRLYT